MLLGLENRSDVAVAEQVDIGPVDRSKWLVADQFDVFGIGVQALEDFSIDRMSAGVEQGPDRLALAGTDRFPVFCWDEGSANPRQRHR